jgi:hypothetical protein
MTAFVVERQNAQGEMEYGTAIDVQTLTVPCPVTDETPLGVKIIPQVLVLWEDARSPAPSYHHPSKIAWVEIPGITDEEDEEDEDDEENESEDTESAEEDAEDAAVIPTSD